MPGITGTPRVESVATVLNDDGNITLDPAIPDILAIIGVCSVAIPAKSTLHLLLAFVAYYYYQDTVCAIALGNVHFNNVLRDFNVAWKEIPMKELPVRTLHTGKTFLGWTYHAPI